MNSNQMNKNLKWFFLSFVLAIFLLSNWVIGSLCLPFLYKYRPDPHPTFEQAAERQLLSMDAIIKRSAPASLSVFVGSSAALNAIDEDAIRGVWKGYRDLPLVPVNFGTTGLLAYELLMLRDKLLSPKVKVVVYLYNSFSFSDNLYSSVYTMRWNTAEFVRMADRRILRSTPNSAIAEAIMRELFFVYRYKTFLSYFLTEAWSNGLVEHIYPTDAYGPGPTPPIRKREKAKLADPNYELTRWYLDSDSGKMTLGYASLIRFAKLAKERSIRLIVMPVPEPEFSNLGEYKQYISTARIDAKVAEICKQNGIDYVPRKESQDFEANDTYFGDNFHMHILGRIKYSEWIAGRVASILGARSYMPVHDKERTVQHS